MNTEDIYDMRYAYDITQDVFPTTSYADYGSEETVVKRRDYRVYLDEWRGVTLNSPARQMKPKYTASFNSILDNYLDDYALKRLEELNLEYQSTFVVDGQTLTTFWLNDLTDGLSDISEIEWGDPVPFKQNDEVKTSSYETGELDTFIDSFKIIEDDNT